MRVVTLFIIGLLLTAFLYPVITNVLLNIVLPAFNHVKNALLNLGNVAPTGGGGGDEIPSEWYPT